MLGYINVNDQEYCCCVGTTIYVFMCNKALLGGGGVEVRLRLGGLRD